MSKIILSQDLRNANLAADPTCRKCGVTKTINDFQKKAVDYWCNACRRDYAKQAYRDKITRMTPDEVKAYRVAVNARQTERRKKFLDALPENELRAYYDRINAGNMARRLVVRDEVYNAYGGYICKCCGETERLFLSIDHINNDGAEHRRREKLQTGEQLYRWLKRNGYPDGFQVLCMNCQWGKRNNGGVCPHQVRCNDYPERE